MLINYLCNVLKLCFYTINITVDTQFIALDTSNGATREKLFCCLDTYGIVTLPYKPLYAIVTISITCRSCLTLETWSVLFFGSSYFEGN